MTTIDLSTLEGLVRQGDVDTVVTVFADPFGRFMGKRITGHFFLEEVAEGGMHAFESSELARRAFGDDVVEHYLHAARTEVRKFSESVTCWERNRHFERT